MRGAASTLCCLAACCCGPAAAFAPQLAPRHGRQCRVARLVAAEPAAVAAQKPAGPPIPGGGGGPPPGGGGGPPKGGPPERTAVQKALDTLFELAFKACRQPCSPRRPVLYATEPDLRLDSYKNLQVLWVRALLASSGQLDDPVAYQLLPPASRWLVSPAVAPLWAPVLPKLEWIAQRTSFLDSTLDAWIDGLKASGVSAAEAQIAPADPSLRRGAGAGYDTRALRYSGDQAPAFYEVDLPVVTRAKGVLSSRYAAATGARPRSRRSRRSASTAAGPPPPPPRETAPPSRPRGRRWSSSRRRRCCARRRPSSPRDAEMRRDAPARSAGHPASELALTDNLAPFLRSADRKDADDYFGGSLGLQLRQHETLWGGAIQFARAGAKSGE
ncbi:hypothetical protein EMIHUDRAFT_439298 [Emiliania huxleyi CCMP1516]|uniref:Uncharacterized protein n=2 Tax=Emiliania huxleyi TaxID=2903 RepID=A0A0D3HYL4_EMIH1|nr:hypothetical protein EMIHUDRAFT_439298 [Emiliania huxleyi CCMP1516]EOD04099.1 hypothetical protein EMIHUDRAFT_439298 [Emiliania huxleyi CCMP1516]|eukprot:XP_005756528.1 hypothetical protein EMIHUDRAFT_439298 [Emiliania huxleyi CCMP1516]